MLYEKLCCRVRCTRWGGVWLLLLAWPATVSPHDGCKYNEWRCGDLCINERAVCQCGERSIRVTDDLWCCHAGPCTWDGYDSNDNYIYRCPANSTALPLSQSCRGNCNYDNTDEKRNYYNTRSHRPVQCADQALASIPPRSLSSKPSYIIGVRFRDVWSNWSVDLVINKAAKY